jgi:hypothetical protein
MPYDSLNIGPMTNQISCQVKRIHAEIIKLIWCSVKKPTPSLVLRLSTSIRREYWIGNGRVSTFCKTAEDTIFT